MRILIIANHSVGIRKGKRDVLEKIASRISSGGGTADITYMMKPGMGKKRSSNASLEGYDAVYAAGGDGTLNDVASGLVGGTIPLGIIPLGTWNGFARGMNIPLDTAGMIDIILKHKTVTIDTGKIFTRVFLATSGIGFDAHIAHDLNKRRTGENSLRKYYYQAVKNYFFNSPEKLTLFFDGKEMRRNLLGLTICNTNQYGGGALIAPQADPKSGTLVAVLIPKFSVFKAILAAKRLFNGTITKCRELEYITFKTLIIKRQKPDLFHCDGEAFTGDSVMNVSVIPSSLTVIAP